MDEPVRIIRVREVERDVFVALTSSLDPPSALRPGKHGLRLHPVVAGWELDERPGFVSGAQRIVDRIATGRIHPEVVDRVHHSVEPDPVPCHCGRTQSRGAEHRTRRRRTEFYVVAPTQSADAFGFAVVSARFLAID
ncbi:hypothetical protein [Halorubrum sp. Ea1]|uniref:hypothetical protein n=1 Tax=Halorubrum sp. Ea1 TaxID=1480718 RepID=UPI00113FEA2F|nr:hypothetical protein [Halorubrum sp. Ea1]